jgi:membrane protein
LIAKPAAHHFRHLLARLRRWLVALGDAGRRMSAEDGFMVAGYMAFTAIVAIFPFLLFITALMSFLGTEEDVEEIVDLMVETLPAEVAETLEPAIAEVMTGQQTGFLTFGILATLWAASNGIEAIRLAFNRAYRIGTMKPFWYRRLQNFLFVLLMGLMVPLMSFLIVLAPLIWRILDQWLGLDFSFSLFFTIVRYLIAATALFFTLVAMHRWLPNRPTSLKALLPGVVLTLVLFILAGTAFSLYLAHFADYSVTYGSMASVVIALLFFYMTSVIVILGAYVNASLHPKKNTPSSV